jgi:uncharacterized protein YbjT (DUF2867 family)
VYTILLTGGTGTLGRHVARRLADVGVLVRVLSRRRLSSTNANVVPVVGDLAAVGPVARSGDAGARDLGDNTGVGSRGANDHVGDVVAPGGMPVAATETGIAATSIDAALNGVGTIVHCASDPQRKGSEIAQTRHLLDAALRADPVPHVVYISIVGVERVPLRYYREKLAAEELIRQSGVPWTILRATQFHEFVASLLRSQMWSPVLLVPAKTSIQPIAADEVAERLVELAIGPARGRVDDVGGPQVRTAVELATAYLDAKGERRRIVSVPLPGAAARGYRAGGHLAPDRAVGRTTFEEFLAATA